VIKDQQLIQAEPERRDGDTMAFSLALIVIGILVMLDRMGAAYGLKEGWPWVVVALGAGGLLRDVRSVPSWITTLLGILILNSRYYSIHLKLPVAAKTYFLPVVLIVLGLLSLWKYRKD
jgi:hypothetical protein